MTLRGVSLKDSLVFDFSGPVMQNGVCLGDVDNDGASELVVASVAGDLAVYSADKCPDAQPWRHAKFDGQVESFAMSAHHLWMVSYEKYSPLYLPSDDN